MKHTQRLMGTLLLSFVFCGAQAQESLLTSGEQAVGSGGSSSYSIGQVAYTTNSGTTGSVAQGVQQAYEISTSAGVEIKGIELSCSVYPNPTVNTLILSVDDYLTGNLSYQLFDLNGKIVAENPVNEEQTSIDMSDFVPAAYFLKVKKNSSEIKTFKIIKNQ